MRPHPVPFGLCLALFVVLAGCAGPGNPSGGTDPRPRDVPSDTGSFSGVVVDEEQIPVPGADVGLADDETRRTLTDSGGRFALHDVPPGAHPLWAERMGYARTERTLTAVAGETVEVTLTLAQIPAPVARAVSYISDAIIELGANAFGIYYYGNQSGSDYRDIFFDVTPDVKSAVVGLQWTPVSPVSAKWMYLGIYLADRQCVTYCLVVSHSEGRSPLVARADGLDLKAEGLARLTINPYIAIQPPCTIPTASNCPQNPDAVAQVARDQRFRLYTTIFFVGSAPSDYAPFPPT